ncbi:MAG TPA: hypothetical protein VG603_06370, partial [Chitinophagales bacterium]|nr:hypothetical protein [Chitinophagales bacterium]
MRVVMRMNITKTVRTAIAVASLAGIIFFISSCKSKGSGTPLVTVESYTGYVYKDSTIAHGQTFNVWIIAQKQGVNDLLETGKFSKSINGGPDSIYQTMVLAT